MYFQIIIRTLDAQKELEIKRSMLAEYLEFNDESVGIHFNPWDPKRSTFPWLFLVTFIKVVVWMDDVPQKWRIPPNVILVTLPGSPPIQAGWGGVVLACNDQKTLYKCILDYQVNLYKE
jgi:hypothetical protein